MAFEDSEPGGQETTGVEIAASALAPETLRQVVEEFITREGTDYGLVEASLETKVADVMRQLERGEAHIVFDPETETVNLVSEESGDRREGSSR